MTLDQSLNNTTNLKIQIITASISFVASFTMAVSIKFSAKSLSTPYRRLIYGLSIADIFLSLATITGPFAIPKDTPMLEWSWAAGNVTTCEMNAFAGLLGALAGPAYTCALCMYYLCRLKFKMSDDTFEKKYEFRFHVAVILLCSIACVVCLVTDVFNPDHSGAYCLINESPFQCDEQPELYGECERGKNDNVLNIVLLSVPWMICLIWIIYCMVQLTRHAITKLNYLPFAKLSDAHSNSKRASSKYKSPESILEDESELETGELSAINEEENRVVENDGDRSTRTRQRVRNVSLLYRREITMQAFSYIGVYFILFGTPMVIVIYRKPPSSFHTALSFLFPLGGFLNILVHTRPNVSALRRRGYSWPRAFRMVLRTGGDLPDLDESETNESKKKKRYLRNKRESSEKFKVEGIEDSDRCVVVPPSCFALEEEDALSPEDKKKKKKKKKKRRLFQVSSLTTI